eukprot:jgi/Tetstr1/436971/TSEL_025743.t1
MPAWRLRRHKYVAAAASGNPPLTIDEADIREQALRLPKGSETRRCLEQQAEVANKGIFALQPTGAEAKEQPETGRLDTITCELHANNTLLQCETIFDGGSSHTRMNASAMEPSAAEAVVKGTGGWFDVDMVVVMLANGKRSCEQQRRLRDGVVFTLRPVTSIMAAHHAPRAYENGGEAPGLLLGGPTITALGLRPDPATRICTFRAPNRPAGRVPLLSQTAWEQRVREHQPVVRVERASYCHGVELGDDEMGEETAFIEMLEEKQPTGVGWLLENVDTSEDDRLYIKESEKYITKIIGRALVIDEAGCGANHHRVRRFWTNMGDVERLKLAWEKRADMQPRLLREDSDAYSGEGAGMLFNISTGTWERPTVHLKEELFGYEPNVIHGIPLPDHERLVGNAMGLHSVAWIVEQLFVEQQRLRDLEELERAARAAQAARSAERERREQRRMQRSCGRAWQQLCQHALCCWLLLIWLGGTSMHFSEASRLGNTTVLTMSVAVMVRASARYRREVTATSKAGRRAFGANAVSDGGGTAERSSAAAWANRGYTQASMNDHVEDELIHQHSKLERVGESFQSSRQPELSAWARRRVLDTAHEGAADGDLVAVTGELTAGPRRGDPWMDAEAMAELQAGNVNMPRPYARYTWRNNILCIIDASYFWPGMVEDVARVKKACPDCDRLQHRPGGTSGRPKAASPLDMQPLPHFGMFFRWHLDLAGPFEATRNRNAWVLVMVEAASKWVELVPLRTKEAANIRQAFQERVLARFAAPGEVCTDGGTEFSGEFHELLVEHDTDHPKPLPYHPQPNGLAEGMVKTVKEALMRYVVQPGKRVVWGTFLPSIELGYRCSKQASTRYSPYELVYGRAPVFPAQARALFEESAVDFNNPEGMWERMTVRVERLALMVPTAMHNVEAAQHREVMRYRRRRAGLVAPGVQRFSPGDFVYVQHRQQDALDPRVRPAVYKVYEVNDNGVVVPPRRVQCRV